MTDIARLGITVDSATVPQATQQLDRLGDQAAVTGRQVAGGTATATRGFASLAAPLRNLTGSNGFRQVSQQLSQVAQQTTATGQPLQALAIQAADIGMVFGPMGIAAGVAAGALLPLAGNLLTTKDNAEEAEEALDTFLGLLGEVERMADRAGTPIDELAEDFGRFAEQVQNASRIAAQARLSEAMAGFGAVSEGIREGLLSVRGELSEYNEALADFNTTAAILGERTISNEGAYRQAERSLAAARAEAVAAADALGLTADQATRVDLVLQNMARAEGPAEIADAAGLALSMFEGMFTEAENIPPEIAQIIVELERALTASASLVTSFEDAGIAAGGVADAAARIAPPTPGFSFGGRDFGRTVPGGGTNFVTSFGWGEDSGNAPTRTGGGMSDAQRLHNERLREAERIIARTRTEAERYASELADLNELHELGYLSAEEYARAVGMVEAQIAETDFGPLEQGINDMADAMAQAIVNGEDMGDAIVNTFKRIAAEYLANDLRNIFGSLFGASAGGGGGGGNFLSSLFGFGGARARGGPVSTGRAYLVGEEGPELFSPGANGAITPAQETRRMGGGGSNITINQTFTGGVTERDLGRMLPMMVEESKRAVAEAVSKGGAYAQVFR